MQSETVTQSFNKEPYTKAEMELCVYTCTVLSKCSTLWSVRQKAPKYSMVQYRRVNTIGREWVCTL